MNHVLMRQHMTCFPDLGVYLVRRIKRLCLPRGLPGRLSSSDPLDKIAPRPGVLFAPERSCIQATPSGD